MIYTNSKSKAEFLFDKKYQLFLNFDNHTDQTKNALLYLHDQLNIFLNQANLHYLDVGCGFGNRTLAIITAMQKICPVAAVALDPSAQLLAIFKKQITTQTVNLVCSTWEDYCPFRYFNLISSIHTFYYIDDWEYAIRKMLACLDKNGKIFICIRTNDDVCKFRDYFYKKIYGKESKERNCDELCELLQRLGIQHRTDYVDSKLNIMDCLLQNENGNQLIEFLLRQPYAAISTIKDEIINYLAGIQKNGYVNQRDGYIWIAKP